jgi:hypothetical protein
MPVVCPGGPPRFISPFIPGRAARIDQSLLPLMVYLPGIDGTGLAASRQFPYLVDAFDLHALSIPGQDRTPFEGLVKLVECAPNFHCHNCPCDICNTLLSGSSHLCTCACCVCFGKYNPSAVFICDVDSCAFSRLLC